MVGSWCGGAGSSCHNKEVIRVDLRLTIPTGGDTLFNDGRQRIISNYILAASSFSNPVYCFHAYILIRVSLTR